ncbi:hypothetical protein [Natronorubrum texcoconense]|uniref:ParB-like nuclease domain-containing protein n=1 Tax=Natronorubrum texcoconense TaxID=1095776 RepID=A0A1G8VQJ0_9EURY|nr:hypothetical protein [Natronorubrum texcoconense]SDJ68224.1 hypothetical protein SAMN04515672_1453 [Natronorubrum texcoconense]
MELRYLTKRARLIYREEGIFSLVSSLWRFTELTLIDRIEYFRYKQRIKRMHPSYWRYTHLPDPFKIIFVDPNSVNHFSPTSGLEKWSSSGTVKSGNWDVNNEEFDETYDLFRAFQKHFQDKIPWENTDFYDRVADQIEKGNPKWGCHSINDLDNRCERLDRLYNNIKSNGYKSKHEVISEGFDNIDEPFVIKNTCLEKYDEVAVDISRDGSLLFVDGRNRLAIAKILNVESIPVRVVVRHGKWQEKRDQFGNGEFLPTDERNHPDLMDLADTHRDKNNE